MQNVKNDFLHRKYRNGRGEIEDCKKLKRNGNLRIAANDNCNKSTNIY